MKDKYLPLAIIKDLILHPSRWKYSDGGFGMPHINNLDARDDGLGKILLRYPLFPVYFIISYGEYDNKKIKYPILTWPFLVLACFINTVIRVIKS